MPRSNPPYAPAPRRLTLGSVLRAIRDFFTGFFALTITTVIFFVLLAVSSYYTVGYFIRGEEVIAPDLTGRTIADALDILKQRKLLLELDRAEPSDALDAGMILRQRPRAASRVKARTSMRVVISSGPRLTTLPTSLMGLSEAEAGIELRRLGFNVGNISYLDQEGKTPNSVLAFDPPAGTGLLPGAKVNVLVAAAGAGALRLMPNLYGLTPEKAVAEVKRYGLEAVFSYDGQDPSATPGTVQGQSHAAGTTVRPGQKIAVVVRAQY
jgi:serine/threonine-protein kinase